MFSRRVPQQLAPNALTRRMDELRARGEPVIDLTVSNPTRAGIEYPREAIVSALADPASLVYDPDPRGNASARVAIANYYRDAHGVAIDADDVVLTASTSEAYAWLFKLLADPGDRVLAPQPSYPLFELLASGESITHDPYSLAYDGAWHLDVASLAAHATPQTRAVLVVHPNNPTGSFTKRDERDRLSAFCAERDLALVVDEVFADYAFAPDPRRVPSFADETRALTFVLSGLSKVVGLPQLKLGWIALAGPHSLRRDARQRLELIADTFLSVGTPIQLACERLLALREPIQAAIVERVRANRASAQRLLEASPTTPLHALHVEGGWYLVLRAPAVHTSEAWALDLLERERVFVHPGYFFDFPSEAHLVVSLLTPEDSFREGFTRLVEAVGRA
jgi:aspartate/methionine/tyrosine aminotransferase